MKQPEQTDLSYVALNNFFNANSDAMIRHEGHRAYIMPINKDFIMFSKNEESKGECPEGKIYKKYGLKFHVSLPEDDREMYNRGWDIVRDTLLRHQVDTFKIIRSHGKMSDVKGQEGKDITIYADAEPGRTNIQWQAVLQDITQNLVLGKVSPGYRAPGTPKKPEFVVSGSNYITYRYFNELTKKSIRPNPDPCNDVNVNVPGQPDIPKLVRQKTEEKQDRKSQEFK